MRIGLVSPFMPHDIADLLDEESRSLLHEIKGITATPVTPLARQWHSGGHELSVYCLDPSIQTAFHLTGERLSIHVLPKRRNRRCLLDVYREERRLITAAVAKEAPEVLSAQWSYEHALAALDTGVPTIVTCHDTPLRYAWISKSLYMTYHLFVAGYLYKKARYLVAVSPYTADHICRYFHTPMRPHVIPNGLPEGMFERGTRRINDVILAHNEYILCSVGGWGSIKNLKTLLVAFSEIRKELSPVRLVLIGRGLGPGEAGEKWARAKRLYQDVEFLGTMPRELVLSFLEQKTDMMVHPSLVECNPMVLMEALACGVPVLAGKSSGGVAWTLGEGRYGRLCDMRAPVELGASIISFRKALEVNPEFVKNGWLGAREHYHIENIANQFISLFREALKEVND